MQNLFFNIEDARLIRKKRSEIKKNLKNGILTLQVLLDNSNEYIRCIMNMKLYDLIASLPGFGKVNAEKLMKKLNISLCKRLKGLGKNQKVKFFQYFNIIGSIEKDLACDTMRDN